MRPVPKRITTTTLIMGLAILTSPAHAAVAVEPPLELLEEISIVEEVSMDTYEPDHRRPTRRKNKDITVPAGVPPYIEMLMRRRFSSIT